MNHPDLTTYLKTLERDAEVNAVLMTAVKRMQQNKATLANYTSVDIATCTDISLMNQLVSDLDDLKTRVLSAIPVDNAAMDYSRILNDAVLAFNTNDLSESITALIELFAARIQFVEKQARLATEQELFAKKLLSDPTNMMVAKALTDPAFAAKHPQLMDIMVAAYKSHVAEVEMLAKLAEKKPEVKIEVKEVKIEKKEVPAAVSAAVASLISTPVAAPAAVKAPGAAAVAPKSITELAEEIRKNKVTVVPSAAASVAPAVSKPVEIKIATPAPVVVEVKTPVLSEDNKKFEALVLAVEAFPKKEGLAYRQAKSAAAKHVADCYDNDISVDETILTRLSQA